MLKSCMLVGLNWAEPIMIFLLHVTWSCIIHAYVPFFSLFLVYLLIGAFLFVSLSPPSLSNSLHMAPKRKFAPSRNPLRFGTSSSNPTPLSIWFSDEKARQDFSKNFSKCGIHSKHHVILSDFSDTTLPTVIHSRGWESLCEIPRKLSHRDHTRVLLQNARFRYLYT